jgi:hypothetical protein
MDTVFAFVENPAGPDGYSAIFEATAGEEEGTPAGGYLYVCDSSAAILRSLEIYKRPAFEIRESDIQVFWSSDRTKCGVAIWGRMQGIIDIGNNREISAPLESPASEPITAPEWLEGFEDYLDRGQFIRARQRFWKEKAREQDPRLISRAERESPIETNFVVYTKGPRPLFGVFEDDGDTGYLYLLNASEQKILQRIQIYDQAKALGVGPDDVQVLWSKGGIKCGVSIWDKIRGIIDRTGEREGRVKLESRATPGIGDVEWLSGF